MDFTLGQTLAAYVSAACGAVLAVSMGVSHRQLCALISFAAGTLLSATLFHILPEAWQEWDVFSLFVSLASGYVLFYIISRYISHVCPACAASHFEHHHYESPKVMKFGNVFGLLAIALTVHSLTDGIAIALGHEVSESTNHSVFFTIAIHKLPEGLALCALLMKAGYEKIRAVFLTLILELSTIAGWAAGHWGLSGNLDFRWLDLIMVHIAGGFVYLALHAAINEAKDHSPKFILTFFMMGFLFMALVR